MALYRYVQYSTVQQIQYSKYSTAPVHGGVRGLLQEGLYDGVPQEAPLVLVLLLHQRVQVVGGELNLRKCQIFM